MKTYVAYIDGNMVVFDENNIDDYWHTYIETDGAEYIVFTDVEEAGKQARDYWEALAQNDPKEFSCLVGEETLIQWGMGHFAGPGITKVKSLKEWLDLWLDTPEERWASYDGNEVSFECKHPDLDHFTVAYRTN